MAIDTQDPPTVEERYTAATNTSDMTFSPHRRGQADVIGAAAMVAKRHQLAEALVHLRGQWDKIDKPRKRTAADIAKRAAEIPDKKGKPDLRRATIEAMVWHASAMRACAARLGGRNATLGLLTEWARENGVDTDLLSPALYHWLAPKCPACDGRMFLRLPDAPSLTNRKCDACAGTGEWPKPLGAHAIHAHIRRCLGDLFGGQRSIKSALY
ncbi:MAG: hypothetical protein WC023_06540 [Rhodocyclaceae bacterium]